MVAGLGVPIFRVFTVPFSESGIDMTVKRGGWTLPFKCCVQDTLTPTIPMATRLQEIFTFSKVQNM